MKNNIIWFAPTTSIVLLVVFSLTKDIGFSILISVFVGFGIGYTFPIMIGKGSYIPGNRKTYKGFWLIYLIFIVSMILWTQTLAPRT